MKPLRIATALAVAALTIFPAAADWDEKAEAAEAAKRKAEQQESARRKADADRQRAAAEAKVYRGHLGKEAEGKSDAEVKKIYNAKMNAQLDMAKKAQAGGAPGSDMAKGDAQLKAMTGKSMQDMQNMTPAQQEAFAKQMEKQYGGAK